MASGIRSRAQTQTKKKLLELLGRLLAALLFGVTPTDPGTIAAVGILLLGVAGLASYIPTRRATRVDPTTAFRYE